MKIDSLHYISQHAMDGSHLTAIQQALDSGCKWIQLRIKDEAPGDILEYAITARHLCEVHGARLIINDYPEIALKSGAQGLHLGLDDMPIGLAREIVGTDMIIGGTANTLQQVEQRIADGADYIGLGPFRYTTTKKKLSPVLGLEGYQRILNQMKTAGLSIPVIAIGGITQDDVGELMKTGIHGVAISGAITFANDPRQVVTSIYQQTQDIC